MKIKCLTKFVLLLLISSVVNAQTGVNNTASIDNEAKDRARDIIAKSREQTNKKVKVSDLKSIVISIESTLPPIDRFDEAVSNTELSVLFPDKINSRGEGTTSQTRTTSTTILNSDKFDSKLETFSGGKPFNVALDFGSKEAQKNQFKWRTWSFVFPITLDPWYFPLEFKFLAIAESKDGKAEVLEAVSKNNVVYRLFFDQTSHLLLMMTRSFQTKDSKQVEDKYFFSDYREDNGLILAHKIIVQQNGELIESRIIKSLKINPDLKSDMFDIKEK